MGIVVKDGNNSNNTLKTTFDSGSSTHTPHHIVDGTTAVSGNIIVTSGQIEVSGTAAVSGAFPSGVQYTEQATPGSIVGTAALGEQSDGKLVPLQQNTSGYLFVVPRHPHSEPNKMFNALGTISSDTASSIKSAPSDGVSRYFVTSFSASNTSATGTIFSLFSDSDNIFNAYIAESGGGIAMTMPTPIVCGTGQAIKASVATATESVLVTVQGYMDL